MRPQCDRLPKFKLKLQNIENYGIILPPTYLHNNCLSKYAAVVFQNFVIGLDPRAAPDQ